MPVKLLFPNERLETFSVFGLFRTAIVHIGGTMIGGGIKFLLYFCRDHHATLTTTKKSGVELDRPFFVPGMTSFLPYLLHGVKQFLWNEWLVSTFVDFPGIPEVTIVERVGQDPGGFIPHDLAATCSHAVLRQKDGHIIEGIPACGEFLIQFLDDGSTTFVDDNSLRAGVIEISGRRFTGKFATPYFLTQPTPGILGEGIHEVFGLSKRDRQHKFALWRGLKPELGELEKLDRSRVHKIDKPSSVHAVARKSVRVPGNYAARFSFFNTINHPVKYRSSWNLC
ncbi:MAG: hypothetical protein Q8L37_06865 [Candidatus Gottesmanbacteria bacterium]|nr:hypothetical protein [Candidatus Gottesmanbacteria bacterium]